MKLPEELSIRGEYRRGMRERRPSVFPPYRRALLRRITLFFLFGALGMPSPVVHAQEQHEDEIVANLSTLPGLTRVTRPFPARARRIWRPSALLFLKNFARSSRNFITKSIFLLMSRSFRL